MSESSSAPPISVVLIASNAAVELERALESVKSWAAEIVLVDGGSSDATVVVAEKFGARVFAQKLESFGRQKQFALDQARYDWAFVLDCDEAVSSELSAEISRALQKPAAAAYRLARKNFYFGRFLRHGGKFPDWQTRLLNRKLCRFSDDVVHEKIVVRGRIQNLKTPLEHYTYPNLATWLQKLGLFAEFRCKELQMKNVQPRFVEGARYLFLRPATRFLRRFIFKKGFLDGIPGYLACLHDALTDVLGYFLLCRHVNH